MDKVLNTLATVAKIIKATVYIAMAIIVLCLAIVATTIIIGAKDVLLEGIKGKSAERRGSGTVHAVEHVPGGTKS